MSMLIEADPPPSTQNSCTEPRDCAVQQSPALELSPVRRPSRPLAVLLACIFAAGGAHALDYAVEIEAPETLAVPLRKGLNLIRWQGDPQMTPGLLRRLADEAVAD
ncbi:MAG: hypothetical protein OEV97_02205, partial [Betaproteobacteria bacterium]|nr:hypothetical protein [Betaproteobacteria bacterium]